MAAELSGDGVGAAKRNFTTGSKERSAALSPTGPGVRVVWWPLGRAQPFADAVNSPGESGFTVVRPA